MFAGLRCKAWQAVVCPHTCSRCSRSSPLVHSTTTTGTHPTFLTLYRFFMLHKQQVGGIVFWAARCIVERSGRNDPELQTEVNLQEHRRRFTCDPALRSRKTLCKPVPAGRSAGAVWRAARGTSKLRVPSKTKGALSTYNQGVLVLLTLCN